MTDSSNPEVNPSAQPDPGEVPFDLAGALSSVLAVRTNVPEDALTAPVLGGERAGHGVLIDAQGLIVTIGYLITEADKVWLFDIEGRTLPGHVVGYDQETGFGLVQALGALNLPPMSLGQVAQLNPSDPVIVASHGGLSHAMRAEVSAKREFAGYWEYVLDEAIFTQPAHPSWGGAALIGFDGRLYGIGSLLVQETRQGGEVSNTNMFVPIDLLGPAIDDLLRYGRPNRPARPWLGMFVYDVGDSLLVAGVYRDCPAHRANLQPGDVVTQVNGEPVSSLADLFRRIWALGPAGVSVPMTVMRESEQIEVTVRSIDRNERLKTARLH